jgi:hypothetical protein
MSAVEHRAPVSMNKSITFVTENFKRFVESCHLGIRTAFVLENMLEH